MAKYSVVLDSCVLYPAPLRDTLMRMALFDMFKANWTDMIHEGWIAALTQENESERKKMEQARDMMNSCVRDSIVTGFDHIIDGLELPDPNDRHVLAAAIRCNADAIITKNLKNFPEEALEPYDIEAIHPDDFLFYQIDMAPVTCCDIFNKQRQALKTPYSVEEFLASLLSQELPQTVSKLREYESYL